MSPLGAAVVFCKCGRTMSCHSGAHLVLPFGRAPCSAIRARTVFCHSGIHPVLPIWPLMMSGTKIVSRFQEFNSVNLGDNPASDLLSLANRQRAVMQSLTASLESTGAQVGCLRDEIFREVLHPVQAAKVYLACKPNPPDVLALAEEVHTRFVRMPWVGKFPATALHAAQGSNPHVAGSGFHGHSAHISFRRSLPSVGEHPPNPDVGAAPHAVFKNMHEGDARRQSPTACGYLGDCDKGRSPREYPQILDQFSRPLKTDAKHRPPGACAYPSVDDADCHPLAAAHTAQPLLGSKSSCQPPACVHYQKNQPEGRAPPRAAGFPLGGTSTISNCHTAGPAFLVKGNMSNGGAATVGESRCLSPQGPPLQALQSSSRHLQGKVTETGPWTPQVGEWQKSPDREGPRARKPDLWSPQGDQLRVHEPAQDDQHSCSNAPSPPWRSPSGGRHRHESHDGNDREHLQSALDLQSDTAFELPPPKHGLLGLKARTGKATIMGRPNTISARQAMIPGGHFTSPEQEATAPSRQVAPDQGGQATIAVHQAGSPPPRQGGNPEHGAGIPRAPQPGLRGRGGIAVVRGWHTMVPGRQANSPERQSLSPRGRSVSLGARVVNLGAPAAFGTWLSKIRGESATAPRPCEWPETSPTGQATMLGCRPAGQATVIGCRPTGQAGSVSCRSTGQAASAGFCSTGQATELRWHSAVAEEQAALARPQVLGCRPQPTDPDGQEEWGRFTPEEEECRSLSPADAEWENLSPAEGERESPAPTGRQLVRGSMSGTTEGCVVHVPWGSTVPGRPAASVTLKSVNVTDAQQKSAAWQSTIPKRLAASITLRSVNVPDQQDPHVHWESKIPGSATLESVNVPDGQDTHVGRQAPSVTFSHEQDTHVGWQGTTAARQAASIALKSVKVPKGQETHQGWQSSISAMQLPNAGVGRVCAPTGRQALPCQQQASARFQHRQVTTGTQPRTSGSSFRQAANSLQEPRDGDQQWEAENAPQGQPTNVSLQQGQHTDMSLQQGQPRNMSQRQSPLHERRQGGDLQQRLAAVSGGVAAASRASAAADASGTASGTAFRSGAPKAVFGGPGCGTHKWPIGEVPGLRPVAKHAH
eukprot:jgi/Botrbrau1/23028/Bobra.136_1s0019.2